MIFGCFFIRPDPAVILSYWFILVLFPGLYWHDTSPAASGLQAGRWQLQPEMDNLSV